MSAGAVNDTDAVCGALLEIDARTPVGEPGSVTGTAKEFEGSDAGEVPAEFVAVTVQV